MDGVVHGRRWTMDDGRCSVTQRGHAIWSRKICEKRVFYNDYVSVTKYINILSVDCLPQKKDFQLTVSFQTKCDEIFKQSVPE